MRTCVYGGSFDPITNGHLDIIHRAAEQYDRVVIAVATNSAKKGLFTPEERLSLIGDSLGIQPKNDPKFRVCMLPPGTLLAQWAKDIGAHALVRGLRANMDFEAEFQLNMVNKKLVPGIDTVFFMTAHDQLYTSSSIAKEIATVGGDLGHFVPHNVAVALQERLRAQ